MSKKQKVFFTAFIISTTMALIGLILILTSPTFAQIHGICMTGTGKIHVKGEKIRVSAEFKVEQVRNSMQKFSFFLNSGLKIKGVSCNEKKLRFRKSYLYLIGKEKNGAFYTVFTDSALCAGDKIRVDFAGKIKGGRFGSKNYISKDTVYLYEPSMYFPTFHSDRIKHAQLFSSLSLTINIAQKYDHIISHAKIKDEKSQDKEGMCVTLDILDISDRTIVLLKDFDSVTISDKEFNLDIYQKNSELCKDYTVYPLFILHLYQNILKDTPYKNVSIICDKNIIGGSSHPGFVIVESFSKHLIAHELAHFYFHHRLSQDADDIRVDSYFSEGLANYLSKVSCSTFNAYMEYYFQKKLFLPKHKKDETVNFSASLNRNYFTLSMQHLYRSAYMIIDTEKDMKNNFRYHLRFSNLLFHTLKQELGTIAFLNRLQEFYNHIQKNKVTFEEFSRIMQMEKFGIQMHRFLDEQDYAWNVTEKFSNPRNCKHDSLESLNTAVGLESIFASQQFQRILQEWKKQLLSNS